MSNKRHVKKGDEVVVIAGAERAAAEVAGPHGVGRGAAGGCARCELDV